MITLSVDPTSQSFADGQALGALLITAAAMAVIWFATRTWRRGPVPATAVEAERAFSAALRRRNIVVGVLLVVAAAGLVRACSYEGQPPTANAAPVAQERVIAAAPRIGAYRLLSGAEAAQYEQPASGKKPRGKHWFYDGPGQGPIGAILQINAVEWDAGLAEEKRSDTMTYELRNFFAGAKASEVTTFEAGPWGGQLSCGFIESNVGVRPIVCAWTDGGTSGSVVLADEKSLPDAATVALRFRTASEKRT
ncbi:hypothetical protein [Streptomyces sp. NPDC056191]|uniref:hypothetical protein n=1 Tax=unclassified Streptomyces TaxID=2593676 RepID=UPI0035E11F15